MLNIQELSLNLNGKSIIDGLNLQIGDNEIHGIIGENGTGKTTLAYLLMGANNYKPNSGRILFNDEDVTELSISQRAKKGMSLAWQEPARIEGISVRDYLKLSGVSRGAKDISRYLLMVGLEPDDYFYRDIDNTLSGGERKRIEMASILAMRPKLAILDEPDSGIDVVSLPFIMDGIIEMNKHGTAVLLITHSEKMLEIAHEASVMCAGKVLRTGKPAEMSQWFRENCQKCAHINVPEEEEQS